VGLLLLTALEIVFGQVVATEGSSVIPGQTVALSASIAGCLRPTMSGSVLLTVEGFSSAAPVIRAFSLSGQELPRISFSVPGAERTAVFGFGRSSDGTTVLCGNAFAAGGQGASYIAFIPASSQNPMVVRSTPYSPYTLTVAPDGTIWTAGYEVSGGSEAGAGVNRSAGVLRHFDKSGKVLGAFLPRTSFKNIQMVEYGYLGAAVNRVGWYSGPRVGPGAEYFEVSTTGEINQSSGIPLQTRDAVTGLALTDDGNTFVSIRRANSGAFLLKLDKATQTWLPVRTIGGSLYGASGNSLLFSTSQPDVISIERSK
jgi:hypothetical protein